MEAIYSRSYVKVPGSFIRADELSDSSGYHCGSYADAVSPDGQYVRIGQGVGEWFGGDFEGVMNFLTSKEIGIIRSIPGAEVTPICPFEFERVVIPHKVDLDVIGAGYLFRITREHKVLVVDEATIKEDLNWIDSLCLEVGQSEYYDPNGDDGFNFDHHTPDGPTDSATLQVFKKYCRTEYGEETRRVARLVKYIDQLDTKGPRSFQNYGKVQFPTLSDVIAGMLLITRDQVEQFHRGVEILNQVISEGQGPFGMIRGFDSYAEAKAKNNRQVAKAAEAAEWSTTKSGRKLGHLETDFFGAPGVLYGMGAEIVVVFAPQFGNPPVPKFTIAGNDVRVDGVLKPLNALESGWGGPATGTIVGSPRQGSRLSLEEVVNIVKEVL